MKPFHYVLPFAAAIFVGCTDSTPPAASGMVAAKPAAVKVDEIKLTDEEVANIKKLPDAADQQAALDQKICAVNEEDGKPVHLGAMDVPIKKVVNGKTVFICCNGCSKDLAQDPEKYLARVGK